MLGNGRPFVILFHKPRVEIPQTSGSCREMANTLERLINDHSKPLGVAVNNLRVYQSVTEGAGDAYKVIQTLGEEKEKTYACLCYSSERDLVQKDMDTLSNALANDGCMIHQKTPIRVAHRRSMLTRKKKVACKNAVLFEPRFFGMRLVTDAGTYIKEFVHGDFNRTTPSITSLLKTPISLVQLDVLGLSLPKLDAP